MLEPHVDETTVQGLQQWFGAECNGDWEHSYGVVIETTDNPGWSVEIDLNETRLACRGTPPVKQHISQDDWLHIEVTDTKFIGTGDPTKLVVILEAFMEFRNSVQDDEFK
jgi:hypothetical protein